MDTKDSKTKIRHKRRYFFTGPKHVGPGGHLSLNVNAFNALNKIAEHGGQTVQGVIYDILEDHLVTLAENKEIDWPNEPLKSVLLLPETDMLINAIASLEERSGTEVINDALKEFIDRAKERGLNLVPNTWNKA